MSAAYGVPSFNLGIVPYDCRLPHEPSDIFALISRHGGVMLHSISMDVCTVDESVNSGLDAPKTKHDSILMALNHGMLTFGSKDRYYDFSISRQETFHRYTVIMDI